MLTKGEWMRLEETAAAMKRGERRARWHAFKRWHAGWAGIAVSAGAVGLACWWLWTHAIKPLFSDGIQGPQAHNSLPAAFWWVTIVVVVGIAVTFRRRAIPLPAHLLIIRAAISLLTILGLGVFALSYLVF